MQMNIDMSDFLAYAERMGRAAGSLNGELQQAVNQVADEGAKIAQAILAENGSVVTGDLRDSISGRPGGGGPISANYGPTDDAGPRVEFGRGPVRARSGGSLKFQIKGRGPYLYRKSVGPAAPRPFMRPSVARLRPIANKILGSAVISAVNKV